MADNEIDLTISVNPKPAVDGLNEVNKAGEKVTKTLEKTSNVKPNIETGPVSAALEKLNGKVNLFGAAVVAAFSVSAITNFFGSLIDEAIDAENSITQLNAALARAGTYSAASSKAMTDFASAMMKVSTVDDDVIVGQLAIARNFTKSDEQARQLVKSAMDLSAAMGVDLGTATEMLGRTMDGTAGRLAETVPLLKNVSAESLKAGVAIEIVGKQFAGAAQNKLLTFQGSLESLGNQFGNLQAALGSWITRNPVIVQVVTELGNVFSNLTEQVDKGTAGAIGFINKGIIYVIQGIRSLLPSINTLASFIKAIIFQFDALYKGIMTVVDGIKILGKAWDYLTGTEDEKIASLEKIGDLFDGISKRADDMADSFMKIGDNFFTDAQIKSIDEGLARIQESANKAPIEITPVIAQPTGDIKYTTKEEEKAANTELKIKNTLEKELQDIAVEAIKQFADALKSFISAMGQGAEGAKKAIPEVLAQMVQGAGTAIGSIWGPIGAAVGSGIGGIFGEQIKLASQDREKVAKAIDEFFMEVPNVLNKIADNMPMIAEKVLGNLPNLIIKIVDVLPKIISAFAKGADDLGYELAKNPRFATIVLEIQWGIVEGALKFVTEFIKGTAKGLGDLIKEKWNAAIKVIGEKMSAAVTYISDKLLSLTDFIQNLNINDISKGISDGFAKLGSNISDVFGRAWDGVSSFFTTIFEGPLFKNLGNILTDGFKSIFSPDLLSQAGQAIIDGMKEIFAKLDPTGIVSGEGPSKSGGLISGTGTPLDYLASGGVVPAGFPNDSYPAMLSSNEVVVPAATAPNLFSLIDKLATGENGGNEETNRLLRQMISLMASQQQTIEVKLNRDTLAKAIIALNKDNRRLA